MMNIKQKQIMFFFLSLLIAIILGAITSYIIYGMLFRDLDMLAGIIALLIFGPGTYDFLKMSVNYLKGED